MPRFTVDSTKAVCIPADENRRKLRWRIATTADGGGVTHVSERDNLDADSDTKCGIPYDQNEGETLIGHHGDVGKALWFRSPAGVTSKVYWDSKRLAENPV